MGRWYFVVVLALKFLPPPFFSNVSFFFLPLMRENCNRVLLEREAVQGVRRMHERYERFAFPEDGITFSSTSVYWRPRGALASSKGGGEEHSRAENELVNRLDKVDIYA